MMHRRIRHLRLSSVHADHAHHGRVLLEDALRTATLGDEGRLIIVRRLDLGRLPLRASATHWSRRIEESFRDAPSAPVRFDTAGATRALAIYFDHRTAPWIALAERVARGGEPSEWFWPAAVPGWNRHAPRSETLRLCLRRLAADGGLALTLELATRLHAANTLTPLLEAVQPNDLASLQPDLAPAPLPGSNANRDGRTPQLPSPAATPLSAVERTCVEAWGALDVRTRWLAACHVALPSAQTGGALPGRTYSRHAVDRVVENWIQTRAPLGPGLSPVVSTSARPEPSSEMEDQPNTVSRPTTNDAPEGVRQFTRAGGLFFILPLLKRTGLPNHLESRPEEAATILPWQILNLGLKHARTPADDPCVVALRDVPQPMEPIGHWLRAANRQALRLAQMNLRQIIVRPALVTFAPTHLDVFFRPGDADIRIRRAALDLDPGWVPWLGRVVSYHFNRED